MMRRLGRLFELSWGSLMRLGRKLKDVLSKIVLQNQYFWMLKDELDAKVVVLDKSAGIFKNK